MNKIARFSQRRLEEKAQRIVDKVSHLPTETELIVTVATINNAKVVLSAWEQIDVAKARYLSGELCLFEMVDEVNRINQAIGEQWQLASLRGKP